MMEGGNTKITFDVRGFKYEVVSSQLKSLPHSRIGKLKALLADPRQPNFAEELDELCDDYDLKANEFYFNRDPFMFKMILNLYTNGKLHIDDKSCVNLVQEELAYWQLDATLLSSCCKEKFYAKKDAVEELIMNETEIIKKYTYREDFGTYCLPKLRERLWMALEMPGSSWYSIVNFESLKFFEVQIH